MGSFVEHADHVEHGADVTVGCVKMAREEAPAFGVMHVDDQIPAGLIVGEDPKADARRFRRSPNGVVLITTEMLSRL